MTFRVLEMPLINWGLNILLYYPIFPDNIIIKRANPIKMV